MYTYKLHLWWQEACREYGQDPIEKDCLDWAIYPKRFYQHECLNQKKTIDFLFIGSFYFSGSTWGGNKEGIAARIWVRDFAQKHFTNDSFFANTTGNYGLPDGFKWITLGDYDHTFDKSYEWMVPKKMPLENRGNFDEAYFSRMAKSKFCLCPAGDAPFSMRFYEALMTKSIPIVDKPEYTWRSEAESKLDYKYYLSDEKTFEYRQDWVDHNYELFLEHHTLERRIPDALGRDLYPKVISL